MTGKQDNCWEGEKEMLVAGEAGLLLSGGNMSIGDSRYRTIVERGIQDYG